VCAGSKESALVRERERRSVCVCAWEAKRMGLCVKEKKKVCVWEGERRECLCESKKVMHF